MTAQKELFSFLRSLVIFTLAIAIVKNYIVLPVQIHGSSMYPSLENEASGYSNLLGYHSTDLKRFDIVIIYIPQKDEYIVKRLIGLPGETVSYQNGMLYINGEHVAEDFLDAKYVATYNGTFMNDVAPVVLGEDEYYCLGDNRPHSSDSRYYGPFPKENIRSKGIFLYWPLRDFGLHTW